MQLNILHSGSARAVGWRQTLIIRDERVTGTLPASYAQALPRLQVLSLSGLLLGGSLPGAWAGWTSLRQLALYSNQVRPCARLSFYVMLLLVVNTRCRAPGHKTGDTLLAL